METEHPVERLVELLNLDPLDRDLFLGSPGPEQGRLFGGLVTAHPCGAAIRGASARSGKSNARLAGLLSARIRAER